MFNLKMTNPFVEEADKKGKYTPIEGPDGRWVHNKSRVTLAITGDSEEALNGLQVPAKTTRTKLLQQAGNSPLVLEATEEWLMHSDRSYPAGNGKDPIRYVEYRPSKHMAIEALCL